MSQFQEFYTSLIKKESRQKLKTILPAGYCRIKQNTLYLCNVCDELALSESTENQS